jgi:segregation and condensation protein A
MGYEVSTEVFEGPFDLLLRLINAEQVNVHEVSLARIVDGFLAGIERMQALDLDVATEFLLIAATLVELKCRSLLPLPDDVDAEEVLALFEERDLLLSRLVECRTFGLAAKSMEMLTNRAALSVPRTAGPEEHLLDLRPDLLATVTPEMLRRAALRALEEKLRPRVALDHVLVDELTVAEVAGRLVERLRADRRTRFSELTRGLERIGVIVHFLALLELYKQGLVDLEQLATFGELTVTWTGDETAAPNLGRGSGEVLVEATYTG